jgi:hypothetical protein
MVINNLKGGLSKVLISAIFIALLIPTNSTAAGRANEVVNTIRSGNGVPAATLGNDGDFYIDLKSMNIYGPKKNNRWPLPTSLRAQLVQLAQLELMEKMAPLLMQQLAQLDLQVQQVQQVQQDQKVTPVPLVPLVQPELPDQILELLDQKVTPAQQVQQVQQDLKGILELRAI